MMQEAVMASPRWTMGAETLMRPHSSRPGMEENGALSDSSAWQSQATR